MCSSDLEVLQDDPWKDAGEELTTEERKLPSMVAVMAQFTVEDFQHLRICSLSRPTSDGFGVPTLHSMCMGCFAEGLSELLVLGPVVAGCFDSSEKQTLVSLAKRMGILDDSLLRLFVDDEWTFLDISFAGITNGALKDCLSCLPNLKHVSLIGLEIGADVLCLLAHSCSQLRSLRLGGFKRSSQARICKALKLLLKPRPLRSSTVAESWEEVVTEAEEQQPFRNLRLLWWPDGASEHLKALQLTSPKVKVNPSRQSRHFCWREFPKEADPFVPLDCDVAQLASQIAGDCFLDKSSHVSGGSKNAESGSEREPAPEELPVAERFRLAFLSRQERLAQKAERNQKQAWRRYLRSHPSQNLIRMAEAGLPMLHESSLRGLQ